ncbi:phage tail assembly protein [Veronia pacifica]|uniref:Phage tail protein n=1 Tax=Veronia pacifica TaxID=1080227 RepID=A0A1C3E5B6_9GAMM|nr:phage tail assembly protein [Veronia pacifica]ODA28349.1 hypothetical protein A8L45_23120 [Veronia pacifica]
MDKLSTLPFFTRGASSQIAITPITFGAFNKLPHIKKGELSEAELFAQYKASIFACTDITEDEFSQLKAADFNQLSRDIAAFINSASDVLKGEPLDGETFAFDLLFPFDNELGETISQIRFEVPTVGHSEALAALEDDAERELFMFRSVCGLEKQDLEAMALNDYLALKPQVGAFFTQSAAFFRRTMLKPLST